MRWALVIPIVVCLLGLAAGGCGGTIHGEAPDGGSRPDGGGPDGADGIDPEGDRDGDGLPDDWETAAGNPAILDPGRADTDGDGTPDGDEDPDGDGLSNLEEYALSRLEPADPGRRPHPLRADLLVELDAMEGRLPGPVILDQVAAAYAALPLSNPDGTTGVGLHVYLDETDLTTVTFDGSFEQRNRYFRDHGPKNLDDGETPPLPLDAMIHVVVAVRRADIPERGGEVVTDGDGDPEKAGVFIYHDVIFEVFPACERPVDPPLPAITPEEMVAETMVHEIGHCLQLGHDTGAGGGVNYYNIMSVPTSCTEAQMRAHGAGNQDPELGNTESVAAPRFSQAAAGLMRLVNKLSVETATMEDDDGHEM